MKNSTFIFLILVQTFFCIAQPNPKIDSLQTLVKKDQNDTNKVKHLNLLSWELRSKNPDTAIVLCNEAMKIANCILTETKQTSVQQTMREEVGQAYHQIAYAHYLKGNYPLAIQFDEQALGVWNELLATSKTSSRFLFRKAATLGNTGIVYSDKGDFPKALECYFLSLKNVELAAGNDRTPTPEQKQLIAKNFGNIGIVYRHQGELAKSLEYYFKALKLDEELGKKNRIASDLGNIANVYSQKKNYTQALEYYLKALKLDEELGNKKGIAIHLGNIGIIYFEQKDYPKALDYYFKSLKMREELRDLNYVAIQLGNIGAVYTAQKKYKEAETYLLKALALCDSIGILNEKTGFENLLSDLYLAKGDYKKAYEHYKRYSITKDSIFNLEKDKEITRHEMNYEFEKKEAIAKAEQERQAAIADAERRRQRLFFWLIVAVAIAITVIAAVIFRSLHITRKQKLIIEEKNLLITDSIEYARNIQNAILPSDEIIKKNIPESFILFLPKDIVSGDFYWLSPSGGGVASATGEVLLAAIDCTGHGVPGAFMSVMAFNMLENSIAEKKLTQPALILDELNRSVLETLHQDAEGSSAKYGMDIALLNINKKTNKVEFSGAHNPLCIVRENELIELKANKTTIGMAKEKFTNHSFEGKKGDMFYIFTDGYADQKGGTNNKKFFMDTLRNLLKEIALFPATEQKQILEKTHLEWKGYNEQLDDILIIGFRL